jgi:hypothetical protein
MVKDIPRVAANGVGARCVRRGGRGPTGPVMSAPKARVGSVLRKTGRFGNPWRSPVGSLDRNRDLQSRMVHIRARAHSPIYGAPAWPSRWVHIVHARRAAPGSARSLAINRGRQ